MPELTVAIEQLLVRLNLDARQYNSQARLAAANTGAIGASAKTAGRATGGLGQKMKGLATGGGGLVAVAGGAFAVKQAFDGTVGAFANFDDAMTQSLAIMGDVSEEMRTEMSDAAREVAKETTFSAEQAAESYFFLASAGLDAEQSIAALPQVAQFAQAGMFDLATATDLATDAQSVLGLTSEDAGENLENLTRVTDVLVNANAQANATVEQFATSLTQKAGGALRSVEKDLEEGIAVLSVFADQGIKGERGGTILRATLDGLSNNARDNADAFAEFGISVFDSEENMRNMADITADLEDALGPMTVETREAALAQLGFNRRSREGILALVGNSEALRDYEESARSAGNATQEIADKQLESMKKQFELLKSEMADVGLELGEGLLPVFADFVRAAGPVVEVLGLVAQGYNDTKEGIAGLAEEAAASGDPILGVAARLSEFATKPAALVFFNLVKDAIGGAGDAAEEAASGFSTLGGEMSQIPDPMSDAEIAAGDFDSAIQDLDPDVRALFGSAGDLADAQEDVERETINATRALDEQFNLIRGQLDPMFALQQAAQRVAENQAEVTRLQQEGKTDTEEYEQALLDLFEANVDLRGAQIDVVGSSNSTREAFIDQAIELGRTREEAEDLADVFENLNGFSFTPKEITITTRVSGPGSRNIGSFFGEADLRHSGGPGRAGEPYRIRPQEEIFVPSGDGEFLLNNQVLDALRGLTGSSTSTTTNHFNTTVQSTGDPNTDAQLVGAIDSVRRRMETR